MGHEFASLQACKRWSLIHPRRAF